MTEKPTCVSCKYFESATVYEGATGLCRIRAPWPRSEHSAQWPEVGALDWCGEHDDGARRHVNSGPR